MNGDRATLKADVGRDCLQDHFYERKPKIRFHQPIMVKQSRARREGRRTIKTIYIKLIVVKCSIVNSIPHERVIKSIYFTGSHKIIVRRSQVLVNFRKSFISNPLRKRLSQKDRIDNNILLEINIPSSMHLQNFSGTPFVQEPFMTFVPSGLRKSPIDAFRS